MPDVQQLGKAKIAILKKWVAVAVAGKTEYEGFETAKVSLQVHSSKQSLLAPPIDAWPLIRWSSRVGYRFELWSNGLAMQNQPRTPGPCQEPFI